MADKRMFSRKIIETDDFLEMQHSTQNLYFHMSMNADDDGLVDCVRRVIRETETSQKDLEILIRDGYVIPLSDKVYAIRHWKVNNTIPKDRYHKTIYESEICQIEEKNNVYQYRSGLH